MIDYKITDSNPENFEHAKKVELNREVELGEKTITEVIIAEGMAGLGPTMVGLFLRNSEGEWRMKFESVTEDELLFKLAQVSDNLKVKIE